MAKSKVLDLAREVGMEDDKLLLKLKRIGVKVRDKKPAEPEKKVSLSDEKIIERDSEKEIVEKRVKPTVIRRRARTLEVKAEPVSPPLTVAESEIVKEKIPEARAKEGIAEIGLETPKRAAERKELEKEEKALGKPARGREKKETTEQAAASVEAKAAPKETAPSKPLDAVPPSIPEAKEKAGLAREAEEAKPKEAPLKTGEVKVLEKEELLERERLAALAKKKGFVKKRKRIEERMLGEEEVEEGKVEEKETEVVTFRPFRPMKKKVVLKTARKTEVTVPKPIKRIIRIAEVIAVGDLAKRMGVKGGELIKKLMEMGVLVNINQPIDADVASLVAGEFGYEVERVSLERQELLERREDLPEQLKPRPPVVTIMGHVDHGKTMLLDAIRKTNVVEGEAGGITQHIGAYDVNLENGHVVFIDTPGHEAFTAMRARGAQVTDIVVLVVAADDGMMPQTKEAIDHARAAKVPIVVAINKIDKPTANPEKVKKDLSEYGLVPEQWGGTTLFAEVSAKQKTGIKELLDLILLQAEVLELRANPDKPARGVIIESKLDKGRGPVATLLVQEGNLKTGDAFLAGSHYGRVRAMLNDKGQKIGEAPPSTPVEVVGFTDVPEAGETFIVVSEERMAKQISLYRQEKTREKELSKLS
ncbi:MAG TPA: translation initiation factor IF-2, partial [Thermodesulfobacteriota bacterium]|nr:translation initiation factor IF-2 [Thermodesulfobacteriota bacterium]